MNFLISFCLNNRITVILLTLALAVISIFVVKNIPVDVFPELKVPRATIQTEAPGLTAEEVLENQVGCRYMTEEECLLNPRLSKVLHQLKSGFLGPDNGEVHMIVDSLLPNNDHFFVLRDFQSYVDTFDELCKTYKNREVWARMSLHNIAAAGYFTSDRSIRDYANDIWMVRHI